MLELRHLTLSLPSSEPLPPLLNEVNLMIPEGSLVAIVGPSGCGKSTLLKTIAGLMEHTEGDVVWQGRNLAEGADFHPSELGYVPQFGVAHELLTVEECVKSAIRLRTRSRKKSDINSKVQTLLEQTGLDTLANRRFKVLSGGQKRRLALALELVTDPLLLLCDEVTSGLDPKSEAEISHLLHHLARENEARIVINVTHSLAHLSLYDSVVVMYEGHLVYYGPPRALSHYFSVENAEEVYPRLADRSAQSWADSWRRHGVAYMHAFNLQPQEASTPDPLPPSIDSTSEETLETLRSDVTHPLEVPPRSRILAQTTELPGLFTQTGELFARRWKIFFRDRGQLSLNFLMVLGFPLLVLIFGYEGIPKILAISQYQEANVLMDLQNQILHKESLMKSGGLISGLVLMQVVLVTLMASNQAAREIAGEREILEREKLGGLRCASYILSKILFLGILVLVQACWMGAFVNLFTSGVPGALETKLLMLVMASAAMSFVCLGISAMMKSPEKATLLSIYLVGFQLPLSGAVLALPKMFEPIVQPWIAAYWSWSGTLNSMKDNTLYDAVRSVTQTPLNDAPVAVYMLAMHVVVGLILTWVGTKRSQWN